jgi:hypothetical protein
MSLLEEIHEKQHLMNTLKFNRQVYSTVPQAAIVQNLHVLAQTKTPIAQFAKECNADFTNVILNTEFG